MSPSAVYQFGLVTGSPFAQSFLHFYSFISFRQREFWNTVFDCGMATPFFHLMPCMLLEVTLQIPSPYFWEFHLRSLHLSPECLSSTTSLVHSGGFSHILPREFPCFHSFCWPSRLHYSSLSTLPHKSLSFSALHSWDCFLLPSKQDWCIFWLLTFLSSVDCNLCILCFYG